MNSAFEHVQNAQIQIIMCIPKLLNGPFSLFVIHNDSVSDGEGFDQALKMHRLVWAFAVRICYEGTFLHGDAKIMLYMPTNM